MPDKKPDVKEVEVDDDSLSPEEQRDILIETILDDPQPTIINFPTEEKPDKKD